MLPIQYVQLNFARVSNLNSFYKGTLSEMPKVKLMIENIKLLFKLPNSCLIVEVAEGERVYKVTLLENDVRKYPFGYFVYLPLERRLDVYTAESSGIPLIQWKNKKVVHHNYPTLLEKAGVESVFKNIVNII